MDKTTAEMNDSISISNLSKEFSLRDSSRIKPLNNISLTIGKGETVGIIGKNGSGKSTLLKILSGLTKPTSGTIELNGNVSSILDIGSNFAPDLSGLENTEMLLRVNGFSIKRSSDIIKEIHEFSGIGDFFYQPVKTYSSGMFLRLAFSVVFRISADILVLDEVLSVGDDAFRMKCFEFIKQLQTQGKTIVLASHSRQEILGLCTRCLWLNNGKIEMDGNPMTVVSAYFETQKKLFESEQGQIQKTKYETEAGIINVHWDENDAPGNLSISLRHFEVSGKNGEKLLTSEPVFIRLAIDKKNTEIGLHVGIVFYDHFQQPVFFICPLNTPPQTSNVNLFINESGYFELNCAIPANLLNAGNYYISLRFGKNASSEQKSPENVFRLEKAFKIKLFSPAGHVIYAIEDADLSILPLLNWDIKQVDK